MRLVLSIVGALLAGSPQPLDACGIELHRTTAPVRWEPCAFARGCRQMVTDWETPQAVLPFRIAAAAAAETRADGRVTLMLSRVATEGTWRLVADADGPVHFAALETSPRCALGLPSLSGDRFVWRLYDSEVKGRLSEYGGTAVAGRIGSTPLRVLGRGSEAAGRRFTAARDGRVIELDPAGGLVQWSPARQSLGSSAYVAAALREANGTLFWQAHRDGEPVRLFAGDRELALGAADFGSDGRTMVWAERRGGDVSLVASPFTVSAAGLRRRVLATVPAFGFGVWPFAVASGRAARLSAGGVLVFDLATGAQTLLASPPHVTHRELLAVTAREVFVLSDVAHVPTLLRLDLEMPR